MNNKGQSLIVFILILPVIILLLAFFIDSSLSMMRKNKIDGVITDNIQSSLNNNIRDIDKIKRAILKNDEMEININIINDNLVINAKSTKKSLFGKMLNFSWYKLEFNYCGNYLNKKINKNCG